MVSFSRAILKRFWPAEDKGDDDEIIRQVVMQIEAEVDNSGQVGELFNSMVRGLVKISLTDTLDGESYVMPSVTIKPFNIKQKRVKIGKGEDADIVQSEFAAMTMVARMKDENDGTMLSDLYRFFNIELELSVEEFTLRVQPDQEQKPLSEEE